MKSLVYKTNSNKIEIFFKLEKKMEHLRQILPQLDIFGVPFYMTTDPIITKLYTHFMREKYRIERDCRKRNGDPRLVIPKYKKYKKISKVCKIEAKILYRVLALRPLLPYEIMPELRRSMPPLDTNTTKEYNLCKFKHLLFSETRKDNPNIQRVERNWESFIIFTAKYLSSSPLHKFPQIVWRTEFTVPNNSIDLNEIVEYATINRNYRVLLKIQEKYSKIWQNIKPSWCRTIDDFELDDVGYLNNGDIGSLYEELLHISQSLSYLLDTGYSTCKKSKQVLCFQGGIYVDIVALNKKIPKIANFSFDGSTRRNIKLLFHTNSPANRFVYSKEELRNVSLPEIIKCNFKTLLNIWDLYPESFKKQIKKYNMMNA